jgi:hypothetical protein
MREGAPEASASAVVNFRRQAGALVDRRQRRQMIMQRFKAVLATAALVMAVFTYGALPRPAM